MGYIKEKVAYVKGLADGLSVGQASAEGRVLAAILDVLEEMADSVEENEEALADMNECVERLMEESESLNELMFGDSDAGFECPHCGEEVEFSDDDLDGDRELLCPNCGKSVIPEYVGDEDEDDD